MAEVIVTRPFPEPLFTSRRDFASRIQMRATHQIVAEFFGSVDGDLFWPRRRR
jgi:hypothetical protein